MRKSLLTFITFAGLGLMAQSACAQLLPVGPGGFLGGPLGGPSAMSAASARPIGPPTDDFFGDATDRAMPPIAFRKQQIQALRRAHGEVIDLDPQGEAIVRGETLALSPQPAALARAQSAGYAIARRWSLRELQFDLVVLHAPRGVSTRKALDALRDMDPGGIYDFNHLYEGSGATATILDKPERFSAAGASRARVGQIDGGVDASHPVFSGVAITQRSFAAAVALPSPHGTAVASLLVGQSSSFAGAAPGAHLYAADVFAGAPTGGAVDAIVAAMAWMVGQGVPVINISLVGPANKTLEVAVRAAQARGTIIVAAVGNDGALAAPLFPASYPGVIGVTAVDKKKKAINEAARGRQIMFAAPGADMAAASVGGVFVAVRGTSFAAPIVAGLLAQRIAASPGDPVEGLTRTAVDLGSHGADRTFGRGLVGETVRPDPRLGAKR